MGKYLTVILGVSAMACGAWGILATWPLLWRVILSVVPLVFVLGGLLAVLVGLAEIRDSFIRRQPDRKTEKPKD